MENCMRRCWRLHIRLGVGSIGRWLTITLLAIGLAANLSPAIGQTPPARAKPLVIAGDTEGFSFLYTKAVYEEAFSRMGIPVEIAVYPLARRSAMVEAGALDGESSRTLSYGEAHPELVRVDESIIDLTFSVYTANPQLQAKRLEDLPAQALLEYRRGLLQCQTTLEKAIPAERLSTIASSEQGLRKLLAGRSDAYCDIELYVNEALHTAEFRDVTPVRKLFDIASLPTYPYLYKRHTQLAPRLAATLKKMKAQGLLERYRHEAERASSH